MDREYIIAGFRIRLEQVDRLFVRPGSHMARAFEPFAAEADPAASLTMRLIPDCTINKELTGGEPNRELDVFPFDDAEADCHFERTPRGYLFRMVPRNGDRPTLFFKAFNSPDVQSDLLADGREPHQSLMRFGLWIMFGIAISPEAIAIHSSTIECEGRPSCFWENPAREKAPIPGCGRSTFPEHGCSTTTARLSGCTRGRRPLSDRPGAARPPVTATFRGRLPESSG